MKNGSVLAVGINISKKEKDLIKEKLDLKNIRLDFASIKDVVFTIVDGITDVEISGKDLKQYDYVWIQSGWKTNQLAYLLHLSLKSKKIPHNRTSTQITKLTDNFSLASKHILVPNIFFHNGLKIDNGNVIDISKICKFPCIYKTVFGSLGSDVFLIDRQDDIKQIIRDNKKYNRYFFQEYIPNDFDYRVVIANGKSSSVCKRIRVSDKFRNNVALGAKEEFINVKNVSPNILDLAIRATRALKLNWAGVDIVTDKDTGQDYVLEVNRRPALTGESTEILAAYKYIIELVEK
jgi:D-alanine-D-alanine ligase-like ATP-grasp enzyme